MYLEPPLSPSVFLSRLLLMNTPKRILVFLLIFQSYLYFFECPNLFGQYRFDVWTTDNGLPQNGLREITQTPDGYLWFTTFDGLVRFDGVKFTTFNKSNTRGITNNRFTGLYGDKSGNLYATTTEDGVLTIYRNGQFSTLSSEQVPGHYIKRINPDENGELRFLVEDEDRDSESWYYLRNDKFVFSERRDKVARSFEYRGKSGTLWKIEPDKITEIKNGISTVYQQKTEGFDHTKEFFEDSAGGLWIGGIRLFYLKNGKVEVVGEKAGFTASADFHSFWEESDGSVWFANGGKSGPGAGLVRYKDGEFSKFGKESGLSDTSVYDAFKDREGTVWLATNKGLNRLKKKIINTLTTKDGLDNAEVYPIYKDRKGNIWVGSIKGLNVFRNGKFENINLQPKTLNVPKHTIWRNGEIAVQSLLEDSNGKMWIGVSGGIFIAENGKVELLKESEGHHVFAFFEDENKDVWVASNKGILLLRDYKIKNFYSVKDGLPNENMTTIYGDSHGKIWFGGLGGLTEFNNGKFTNYSTKDGLTGNYVRSIYEDSQGTLWIGTYDEGLSRFKNGKFTNYKAENGLYNNGVFAIEEDDHGHFWISSNRGIYRVKRQELNDFADGKIEKIYSVGYGREDGMLNTECNGGRQPASVRDESGKFWFPTQEGVAVIDPAAEGENFLPPPAVIESVTVERKFINFRNGIVIEPGQKNIEITYTGLSLIKSGQIKFKYKLEGHDQDWIDADTKRAAYYSYLPPGNYKFLVKAANSNGVWNENAASFEVELQPFFYQKNSFYVLCVIAVILIFILIWRISVYQLKVRAKLLTRLVAEKTRELEEANINLSHLANFDSLTQVANRRYFEEFLTSELNRAVRSKSEISLILIDIDHFKLFNDTYGHQAGDYCLKKVAGALKETVKRPTDLAARFGGEEFVIVLGGTDSVGATKIADQIVKNVKKLKILHETSETSDYLTISVGVATASAKIGIDESELIKIADKALYEAKESGRDRIKKMDMTENLLESNILEKEFLI